jgi:hypothetical protein
MGYKSRGMESSTGLMTPARRDPGVIRLTQAGLLIAAVGALFVVLGIIPTVGLVMTVVGAVLAARGGVGHSWYTAVAAGAALEVIARLVAESSETLGGWLAVIASLMILCAVSLGYPTSTGSRS